MAPPNDQSESAHALPRPELNPLVNPRLAENMGRWAEVYFTAPPEKREEAVEELLKELESGKPAPGPKATSQRMAVPAVEHFPDPEAHVRASTVEEAPQLTHCQTCGHHNPGSHQFCGMCGTKLLLDFPSELEEVPSHAGRTLGDRHFDRGSLPSNRGSHLATSRVEPQVIAPVDDFDESVADGDELSNLRRISDSNFGGDDTLHWNLEATSSRPYRVYFGAILAMVLIVLAYMAWRSSHAIQDAHQILSALPAASDANAQPSATSNAPPATPAPAPPVSKAETPVATSPAPATQPTAAPPSAGPPTVNAGAANKLSGGQTGPASAPQHAQAQTPTSFSGNGAEELAMALHYLNGSNGVPRNTREAAPWLWKSVKKQNGEATVLLADLFLKGDGVPKNCDQARILLDSAARKGVAGAGERLRYLPAFGCQ